MITQYYCRVLEMYDDKVLLHLESVLDRTQYTERYFKIERFAQVGIEKLCIDFPLHLTVTTNDEDLENSDTIFQEADESIFPVPEIDWNFLELRTVEPLVSKRRSD